MKKKLLLSISTLSVIFISVFIIANKISAADTYSSGGTITGRVNKAPSSITGDNIGLQKGDKVLMGTKSSPTNAIDDPNVYQNEPIAWQLIKTHTYSDYGCITTGVENGVDAAAKICSNTPITSWYSFSTKAIDETATGLTSTNEFFAGIYRATVRYPNFSKSVFVDYMDKFNTEISKNASDERLLAYRNLTVPHNMYKNGSSSAATVFVKIGADASMRTIFSTIDPDDRTTKVVGLGKEAFMPFYYELFSERVNAGSMNDNDVIELRDTQYPVNFWSSYFFYDGGYCLYTNYYLGSDDSGYCTKNPIAINGTMKYVRPAAYLNMDDAVFAVSEGTSSGLGSVKELETITSSTSYSSIYDHTADYDEMKLRMYSADLNADLISIQINGKTGVKTSQVYKNGKVDLMVKANNDLDKSTVSALIFDENNEFKYYMPLDASKGNNQDYAYTLDTSGIPTGKYKISVVNEIYDETTTTPADSSLLSEPLPLEVVEELSDVSFKNNLTDNEFFEEGRNVKTDDLIGTISSKNGVQKIQYELVAPASGENASTKFKLNKDNNGTLIYNKDNSVNVTAKENVKAGVYRFAIKAVDASGNPKPDGITSSDVEIIVFPSSTNIKFTPEKKNGKWYGIDDVTSSTLLGTLSLDSSFSLSGLKTSYAIKDVKVGDTASDDLEITSANAVLGKITAKGTPKAGKHTFTAVVSFEYQGKTYTIEAKDQELIIAPNLYFVKSADSTAKIKELKLTYTDVTANQNFAVFAKGADHLQYRIKSSSSKDGVVSLIDKNTGIFKMEKAGTTYIEVFMMDGNEEITSEELKIVIENAKLDNLNFTKDDDPVQDGKIIETYKSKGTFQLGIQNAPYGSTITYELKDKQTSNGKTLEDVIKVSSDGEVTILNASETHQINKVIVAATVKKTGYADETLEVFINIDQAEQTTFDFPTSNYEEVVEAGDGSFDVNFQKGGSSGDIEMMSEDARITFEGNTVKYEGIEDETILIKAYQKGDRNYKDSAEKTMKLTALKQGETKFTVDISPSKLIYGSTAQFKPKSETDVTYTYEADPSTIDIADVDSSSKDVIIGKKVGNAKFIITRYLNGVENGKTYKTIKVYPKTITVSVKDKTKKVGEALPTYELNTINGLVGSDNLGTPTFKCSAAVMSPKGEYAITAEFPDSDILKNYELTGGGIKTGKLTVTQDEGDKAWYEILGTLGDNNWYTSDVQINLKSGNDYGAFSQNQSDWKDMIEIKGEGVYPLELWFKNTTTGALSTSVKETIKIDGSGPEIESIKAVNSNSTIENILNDISFGNFFKPGTKIQIYTNDQVSGKDIETSKTKEVSYKIYPFDTEGKEGTAVTGTAQSTSEKATVTLNNTGRYKVCAIAKDNAGNTGEEQCAKVSIKDPEKDYDPNDLGCPSVNVTLGTGKAVLNIDRDGNGIPDMDIDTNGDGKADINIDNDKDGKPDTNLVLLKEWNPKICSTTEHSYGYVEGIEPEINIALDADKKLPSLNIDIDGDMKADINIDTNNDKKADLNMVVIDTWKPEKDYIYKEFQYDTMINLKRKVNIDTDGDGLPDVNIDYDGDGLPDLNIDINGNEIPDINIDTNGDGEPDINIDYENDGTIDANKGTITEWKPDLNTGEKDGFKYDTMSNIKVDDPIHELEHDPSGTVIETVDKNNSFNKNQTIVVADITNEMKMSGMPEVERNIKTNQEIKNVLDVKLYEDNTVIQPNGTVRVKIPLSYELKNIKNRSVLIEQKDGTFKEISVIEENGYLIFETDYLGKISVIGDKEENNSSTNNTNTSGIDDSVQKSVKGASSTKAMGGAMTGDTTNILNYIIAVILSLLLILIIWKKKKECR